MGLGALTLSPIDYYSRNVGYASDETATVSPLGVRGRPETQHEGSVVFKNSNPQDSAPDEIDIKLPANTQIVVGENERGRLGVGSPVTVTVDGRVAKFVMVDDIGEHIAPVKGDEFAASMMMHDEGSLGRDLILLC